LEWNLVSVLLIVCAFLFGGFFWLGLVPFGLTVGRCLTCAFRARIAPPFDATRATLLVALLIFLGPLVRTVARYRWRLRRLREVKPIDLNGPTQAPRIFWRERAFHLSYWNQEGKEKESLLNGVMEFLMPRKYLIAVDQGWSDWDLEICQGPWAKAQIRMATENHGSTKRLLRVRCALRMSKISVAFLSAYILAAALATLLEMPLVAGAAILTGLAHAGVVLQQKLHIGHALYHVIESVAHKLQFVPLKTPSKDAHEAS
jgi:hypothetical protein